MKSSIRKIGLALVLISIYAIGINAQVADFEYYNSCEGDSTHFVSTSTYPAGITSYEWIFNNGSPNGSGAEAYNVFAVSGVYYVTLKIYNGATLLDSKSKNVAIYALPVADFAVEDTCLGSAAVFFNNSTSANGNIVSYIWNFGDGEGELIADPSHIYPYGGTFEVSLTVESYYGCVGTFTSEVSVFQLPDATIYSEFLEYCKGEVFELSVDDQYESVIWSSDVNLNLANYDDWFQLPISNAPVGVLLFEATVFEVHGQGQDATICEDNSELEITVHPTPELELTKSETPVIPGGLVNLNVTGTNTDLVEYFWYPSYNMENNEIANPSVNVPATVYFNVDVVDEFGCVSTDSILVEVDLKLNNIITPNADGKNDTWEVEIMNAEKELEVVIYSRLGEEVYAQQGMLVSWDGKYEGEILPQAAYYYVIKYDEATYTGSITLLR